MSETEDEPTIPDRAFHAHVPYPEHADRCQASAAGGGQCLFFRIMKDAEGNVLKEPAKYCKMHGGQSHLKEVKKKALSQYFLTKFKAQVEHFNSSDSIFSLRDEIGISRMMVQEILNKCEDANDLMLHSAKVGQLVQNIHKLVLDAKKLESQLGELMDRAAIVRLCDAIIAVVGAAVPEEKLASVSEQISIAIAQAVAGRDQ